MAVVVTAQCIKCKYTDCVEVCPVDCFYEGEVMVVINPDECIDCGLCEPECPEFAIIPDSYGSAQQWVEINRKFSAQWPRISEKHGAHPEASAFKGLDGKYPEHFSERPVANSGVTTEEKAKVWGRAASDMAGSAARDRKRPE